MKAHNRYSKAMRRMCAYFGHSDHDAKVCGECAFLISYQHKAESGREWLGYECEASRKIEPDMPATYYEWRVHWIGCGLFNRTRFMARNARVQEWEKPARKHRHAVRVEANTTNQTVKITRLDDNWYLEEDEHGEMQGVFRSATTTYHARPHAMAALCRVVANFSHHGLNLSVYPLPTGWVVVPHGVSLEEAMNG